MASLSNRERECLQLRVEGYVYEELAHIMQIRKGVVGALLSRALKNFRNSEALIEQRYNRSRDATDTYSLISQLRLALAETQYRRRIQHRIWAYVFALGLLTAAAALAAVLMK
jgi:DNA-binding CsgD family transcriptional regulator